MSASVEVRGVTLSYEVAGEGPALVWGHGLTGSRESDDELGIVDHSRLASVATVVRYDARGHGRSGSTAEPEGYGYDALALDQLALADALGLESYVAGGASMGAATALHAAVVAPQRVRGLVLMIPPTGWETRPAQVDLYRRMAGVIEDVGVEPVIAAGAQLPPPDPFVGRADWRDRQAHSMRSADAARLARVLHGAVGADLPSRGDVAAITVPTTILAWTGDTGHPVSTAEELGSLIAGAEVHLASTHDELSRWTEVIASFVASVGPASAA